jgi:hypothetical protein
MPVSLNSQAISTENEASDDHISDTRTEIRDTIRHETARADIAAFRRCKQEVVGSSPIVSTITAPW